MNYLLRLSTALLGLAAVLPCQAAETGLTDYSLVPDGTNLTTTFQNTNINTLNGGTVLPASGTPVVYVVSTFTFGTSSDAHLQWQFYVNEASAGRIGVEIQDTGLVQFIGTSDSTQTNFNFAQDMAGQTVTLLAKLSYNATNNVTYGKANAADDTVMNVWINPTGSEVEGSGLSAGDLSTVWNSAGFNWFRQTIQNQNTPGTAGSSSITNTTILTGAEAIFANALALATGGNPPGAVDAGTSTVSAAPTAVPADGTTTSTITVTLKDAGGIPVAGKDVSLSGNGSATIETGENTSNASGVVTFTVKSGTVGVEQFTATDVTDANLVITQTASVDFQAVVVVGPVNAGNSTVLASPASVSANGIATSTITVTLRDSNGILIAGEGVTLSGSPAGATISPAGVQNSDANGRAVFTVRSTTTGPVVFTATSTTDSVSITQTAAVAFTNPVLAQAFNVKFLDDNLTSVLPATPQANVTGLVGVVGGPGETWNQGFTSVNNLVDTTGAIVSPVNVSGLGNDGRVISGVGLSVFNGNRGFFGKGSDTTISITGLTPNTAYDLYIFALSHNAAPWGDITNSERAAGDFVTTNTVLGNGQSQWLDNGRAGTNGNAFIPNGNYVDFQSIVANGSGTISILVDAYDGIPGTGAGATRLQVCGLQIRPASGMSVDYMNWRNASYPALGLPGADDDGDGLNNDYERIFGLNPTHPASASPYVAPFDAGDGYFSYSRRAQPLANLNYKVRYSTDLVDWFEDNAANQIVESATNGVEIMGVEIDPALLAEPRLFVQVRTTPVTAVDPEPLLVNVWGSGNTITVLFSEPMNPSSAANPANYTVGQDGVGALTITDATLSSDGASVTLTLASSLGLATGYTVTLDRVTSGTGQALGSGVSRQFTTWDNDPNGIKVFILAGQSNMVGYGNVETGATGAGTIGSMRYLAVNDASFPDYNYASLLTNPAQPTTSPFRNRSDVKVWWRVGANGNLGGAIGKGDLGPPYRGGATDKIGPEFGFGQVIGDFYASDDVLIIKCAWGGRDLAEKFRPPSAVAKRGGRVGEFFNATIEQTREVLNNLGTQFPEWSGRGYQIVGFGWHQGYNDRISTAFSAEYKDNLPDFISDVRAVFNKPNLPFVIGTTGMDAGPAAPPPYTGYSAVEKAQLWVAGVAQPANVLSSDTRPFWRAPAVSPATSGQGFHWNHNAESLFLIGKALGDDMVNLLTP